MRQLLAFLSSFVLLLATPLVCVAIQSGDKLILIEDAPLRRDNKPVGVIERGTVIEVREVDGLSVSIDKPLRGQISVLNAVPISQAEAFFADKLIRDPNDALTLALRGSMRHGLNRTGEGMKDLQEAIGLRSDDGDLYYIFGKVLLSIERLTEAKQKFSDATKASDKTRTTESYDKTRAARHYVAKGNIDLRQRIYKSAENAFKNAKKHDPDYAPAYLGLGALFIARHQPDLAIDEINQAIEKNPFQPLAYTLKGQALTDKNELTAAVYEFDRSLDLDPLSIKALLGRGFARFYSRNRKLAEVDFDAAGAAPPATLKIQMDRARVFLKLKRLDAAIADLDVVVGKAPASIEARELRAQALEANQQYDLAIRDVGVLLRPTRRSRRAPLRVLSYLSSLHAKSGDYAAAEAICSRMLKGAPKSAEPLLAFARLRLAQGEVDKAIAQYGLAIKVNPESISGYTGRAMAFDQQGEYKKMLEDFRTCAAFDKNQDNAFINNNLAWILATCPDAEIRNGAEAVKYAQAACEAHRYRSPGVLDTLAAAYAEAGEFEEAVKQQKDAVLLAVGDDIEQMKTRVALYEKQQPYREDNRKQENGTSDEESTGESTGDATGDDGEADKEKNRPEKDE